MRLRATLPILASLALLAGCGETGPATPQPTPQAVAMRHMLADINQIRAYLYGSASQAQASGAASDLASWAKQVPALFPPELASQEYVDMSPERARAANAAMNTNAALLLASVQSGNQAAIADQLAATEKNGCGTCHLSGIK